MVVRFATYLGDNTADEPQLRSYLLSNTEWVGLEFKEAKQAPVFGLRKTVAAFANADGGDLFLGVDKGGEAVGTEIDSAIITKILNQAGAPQDPDFTTDLVEVVPAPIRIPLKVGGDAIWFNVRPFGRLVAVLKDDGTLGLFDRPGAESPEVSGVRAIALFKKRTYARLLTNLYEALIGFWKGVPVGFVSKGYVKDFQLNPIRQVIESSDWPLVASADDKALVNGSLKAFLGYVEDQAEWEQN